LRLDVSLEILRLVRDGKTNDVPPKASNFSPLSHHSFSTTFFHLVLQNNLGLVRISLVIFSMRRYHRMLPDARKTQQACTTCSLMAQTGSRAPGIGLERNPHASHFYLGLFAWCHTNGDVPVDSLTKPGSAGPFHVNPACVPSGPVGTMTNQGSGAVSCIAVHDMRFWK
jgi:hypothetical protein